MPVYAYRRRRKQEDFELKRLVDLNLEVHEVCVCQLDLMSRDVRGCTVDFERPTEAVRKNDYIHSSAAERAQRIFEKRHCGVV
jgi:hypothetical protein